MPPEDSTLPPKKIPNFPNSHQILHSIQIFKFLNSGLSPSHILPNNKNEPLKYGQYVLIQNGYDNWESYLDVCGGAPNCSNLYNVSMSPSPDRVSGSGSWEIISASGEAVGSPVLVGDSVHLLNKYGPGSYLDTCGYTSCGGNKYNVSTSRKANRDSRGSGIWRFVEIMF